MLGLFIADNVYTNRRDTVMVSSSDSQSEGTGFDSSGGGDQKI